jgi:hypothetical protein
MALLAMLLALPAALAAREPNLKYSESANVSAATFRSLQHDGWYYDGDAFRVEGEQLDSVCFIPQGKHMQLCDGDDDIKFETRVRAHVWRASRWVIGALCRGQVNQLVGEPQPHTNNRCARLHRSRPVVLVHPAPRLQHTPSPASCINLASAGCRRATWCNVTKSSGQPTSDQSGNAARLSPRCSFGQDARGHFSVALCTKGSSDG